MAPLQNPSQVLKGIHLYRFLQQPACVKGLHSLASWAPTGGCTLPLTRFIEQGGACVQRARFL